MTPRPVLTVALLAAALALVGCKQTQPKPSGLPTAGAVDSSVHWNYAEIDPVEIAVVRPEGAARGAFLDGLREGLYRTLLDGNYSPLDPDYVDASPPALTGVTGPYVLQSVVTKVHHTVDGGMLVSGWAMLVAPTAAGGESLYLMELTDYHIPPEATPLQRIEPQPIDAGEAGRKLGAALLTRLPTR